MVDSTHTRSIVGASVRSPRSPQKVLSPKTENMQPPCWCTHPYSQNDDASCNGSIPVACCHFNCTAYVCSQPEELVSLTHSKTLIVRKQCLGDRYKSISHAINISNWKYVHLQSRRTVHFQPIPNPCYERGNETTEQPSAIYWFARSDASNYQLSAPK